MPFNSTQSIPKELLKFRLDKQLSRLKQILNEPLQQIGEHEEIDIEIDLDVDDKYPEEDKFQLYQRILSWFIMGRLAKSEFDGIFEKLLNTSELIQVHNKVIELLRAIYCDSPSKNSSKTLLSSTSTTTATRTFAGNDQFAVNSFEIDLLPLEEEEIEDIVIETQDIPVIALNEEQQEVLLRNFVFDAGTKTFDTSIENLGLIASEEALISEAMRNPIHEIASNERNVLVPGINYRKGFDVFDGGSRQCTESFTLPDQNLMKQRFLRVGNDFITEDSASVGVVAVPDPISVLACKALEDYMRNILENVATLKFGHQPLLRPPISYIFPNSTEAQSEVVEENENCINIGDLNLLFKLKPWLLADMEADIFGISTGTDGISRSKDDSFDE